ncbi:MAG: chemotaxis protein CheW [Victivallales bacterium]|nr:chemotaxis protein CheW [Victivallales bacterium]
MIGLHFRIKDGHYALPCEDIVEVIPRVPVQAIVGAPDYVPGFFRYRGRVVPLVDISRLAAGGPTAMLLSSRIAVVNYGRDRLLGLLLAEAEAIVEFDVTAAQDTGVKTQVPYLDGIVMTSGAAPLQLLRPAALLPEEVQRTVFGVPV